MPKTKQTASERKKYTKDSGRDYIRQKEKYKKWDVYDAAKKAGKTPSQALKISERKGGVTWSAERDKKNTKYNSKTQRRNASRAK